MVNVGNDCDISNFFWVVHRRKFYFFDELIPIYFNS